MFEQHIELEKAKLLAAVNMDAEYIYLKDIISAPGIADEYKAFFSAEVEWWLYEERIAWRSGNSFDLDNDESVRIYAELENKMRDNTRVTPGIYRNLVDSAVKARLNYIIRPRTALKWFVYRGEIRKTLEEIKLRLNYFIEHEYLKKGIIEELKESGQFDKQDSLVPVGIFELAAAKADDEVIYKINPNEFAGLMEPLFNFFNSDGARSIPIEVIIIYLDDKKLGVMAESFLGMMKEGKEDLTRDEFIGQVCKLLESSEADQLMIEVISEEVEDNVPAIVNDIGADISDLEGEEDNRGSETESRISLGEGQNEDVEINQEPSRIIEQDTNFDALVNQQEILTDEEREQLASALEELGEAGSPVKPAGFITIEGGPSQEILSEEFPEQSAMEDEIHAEPKAGDNLVPFDILLTPKDTQKYIKKLFRSDSTSFFALMKSLEECRTWKDAAREIDIHFVLHKIDTRHPKAEAFRKQVMKRFLNDKYN